MIEQKINKLYQLLIAAVTMVIIVGSIQYGFGQNLPYKVSNVTFSKSDPTGTATTGAGWLNTTTGVVKIAQNSRWINATDSSVIRYVIGYATAKGEKGDQGDKGDNGVCPSCPPPSGGGSSIPGLQIFNNNLYSTITTVYVSATGSYKTVGDLGINPSTTYAGITVTTSDLYDWANIQYALFLSKVQNRNLVSNGNFTGTKQVVIDKDCYRLNWDGMGLTTITSLNNNQYTLVGRPTPSDMNDANVMIQATYQVKGVYFVGRSNQTGFMPGPTYTSYYDHLKFAYLKCAMKLQFNLNSRTIQPDFNTCDTGYVAGCLDIPGATASNSQSNNSFLIQPHSYHGTQTGGSVAYGFYGSSGCYFEGGIGEGGTYKKIIDFDFMMSPNVRDFTMRILHPEVVYGIAPSANSGIIFIRLNGRAKIDGIYPQYPGYLINAGTPAGQLEIDISGINWTVKASDGKLFYNAGNTIWNFSENTAGDLLEPSTITSLFAGTPVAVCTSKGCGLNKVIIRGNGY